MPRSRKRANKWAKQVLERKCTYITDEDVLPGLRLWRFHKNKIRTNVMPEGQKWVFSDTLGIARSRNGKLCLARASKENPDFHAMLCRWVEGLTTADAQFVFTSISLNCAYNAAIHRDANNAGPSLTRSIGDFHGGALHYFADDTGDGSPQNLLKYTSQVLDSHTSWVLFDGRRAHMVSDFIGERYYVVYFSINQHSAVPLNQRWSLPFYPDDIAIAPPKGYSPGGKTQISIRAAFGLPDGFHSLQWRIINLSNLPYEVLGRILKFSPYAVYLCTAFVRKVVAS